MRYVKPRACLTVYMSFDSMLSLSTGKIHPSRPSALISRLASARVRSVALLSMSRSRKIHRSHMKCLSTLSRLPQSNVLSHIIILICVKRLRPIELGPDLFMLMTEPGIERHTLNRPTGDRLLIIDLISSTQFTTVHYASCFNGHP